MVVLVNPKVVTSLGAVSVEGDYSRDTGTAFCKAFGMTWGDINVIKSEGRGVYTNDIKKSYIATFYIDGSLSGIKENYGRYAEIEVVTCHK